MMWKTTELKYQPNPVLERALDALFILHADHEQNCSAHAMRTVGSSHADPYSATAAAAAALYGPLHGGANEVVLRMLEEIGTVDQVPAYVQRVKRGEMRLMGFGHRIYKSYDPRARIIKEIAAQVFQVTGRSQLLDIALELERVALQDEYFISHKLYPNVDFYSGIIYLAMGIPVEMFLCHRPDTGLAGPVRGGTARPRAEDHSSATVVRRLTGAHGHRDRPARAGPRGTLRGKLLLLASRFGVVALPLSLRPRWLPPWRGARGGGAYPAGCVGAP